MRGVPSKGGRKAGALALLAVLLAGCSTGTSFEEQLGHSAWITPAKYQFHDCRQAQAADAGFAQRQRDLEELMARAEKGPGGAAVSFMAYRTEYQQVLGEREAIRRHHQAKRCTLESIRTSDRQVF
jgi:hypothetical protein